MLCGSAVFANATIIYDTFNTGDTYLNSGWLVDPSQSVATPFSVSTSANLGSITLALLGSSQPFTVSLAFGGSVAPGSVLESWTVPGSGGVVTVTPTSTLNLGVGDYYVIAETTGSGGWFLNSIGFNGPFSYTNSNVWLQSNDQPTGVMRIETEAVPEPASFAALGAGAISLLRRRRAK